MWLNRIKFAIGVSAVLISTLASIPALAQEKLRISLDTNPVHVRNKGVDIFAAELKKRVGDKLNIEIYPSGQLFRDRDVAKALRQGAVEMAVPGTWQLDGSVPNVAIQTLPMFYGVDGATVHTVVDGELGRVLNKNMEDRLRVKIIGKWLDLGMQNFFSISKPIETYDDLKGMKIRNPGGTANAARVIGLGATSVLIPFPDVPMAMSQGVIDGVATTYESAYSSKLDESGLKYAFEDHQFLGQYVPMISAKFWSKQPKDIQDAIIASWDVAVRGQRDIAVEAQNEAREALIKRGMKVTKPAPEKVIEKRKLLMELQDDLIKEMKINREAVDIAISGLREANVEF